MADAVMTEVGAWRAWALVPMYPVVLFDVLRDHDSSNMLRALDAQQLGLRSLEGLQGTRPGFAADLQRAER